MGIKRGRSGIYFTDRKHKRLKFQLQPTNNDIDYFPSRIPAGCAQMDFLDEFIAVEHQDGGTAFCEEIPLCEDCHHYDHTRAGAEKKGKRSPCRLGHLCLFAVPEGYQDDFGDYRIGCEDRLIELQIESTP